MPRTETWSWNRAVPKCASVKLESDRGSVQLLENAVSVSTPIGATALKNTTARQKHQQRPAPAAERDPAGAHAASADRHIGAPLEIAALQRKSDHGEQTSTSDSADASAPARRIAADGGVDARRQEHDLRRRADDRLRPEQGQRVDRRQQRAAGDRRARPAAG